MRVFAISDLHVEYAENDRWVSGISSEDFCNDVLICAGDVAQTATLVAFLTGSGAFGRAIFSHMAWLIAAVADAVRFGSSTGGGSVAWFGTVTREMSGLLAVVAKRIVASWAVASLVTRFSTCARG